MAAFARSGVADMQVAVVLYAELLGRHRLAEPGFDVGCADAQFDSRPALATGGAGRLSGAGSGSSFRFRWM